ncbi:hypothetical protein J2Y56_001715 [Pseudomonas sp. BE134]|jgi:hypothetical protein|nr:hypothetical protein [Pseudomonas sp. BE134]MDR7282164.1 hypothetical protein [Pseudomonas corrugata]
MSIAFSTFLEKGSGAKPWAINATFKDKCYNPRLSVYVLF